MIRFHESTQASIRKITNKTERNVSIKNQRKSGESLLLSHDSSLMFWTVISLSRVWSKSHCWSFDLCISLLCLPFLLDLSFNTYLSPYFHDTWYSTLCLLYSKYLTKCWGDYELKMLCTLYKPMELFPIVIWFWMTSPWLMKYMYHVFPNYMVALS